MRNKIISFLLLAVAGSFAAQSRQLNVTSTAGALSTQITDPADVTDLTVKGTVDVRDLEYIVKNMPGLQTLNLGDVSIASLQNYRNLQTSQNSFAGNELPAMIFAGTPLKSIVLPKSLRTISAGALANTAITSLSIPASVTEIDAAAFQGCEKLEKVTMPATVKTIGSNIFDGCIGLKSATWNAPDMPNRAFADCVSLKDVTIGPDVHTIGDEAFVGCSDLTSVTGFGTTFRSVGDRAFWGTPITEIDFSKSTWMSKIGEGAFGQCTKLEKAYFPEALTEIGASAFLSASALTELKGAQSVTTIPTAMLMNASSVTSSTVLGRYATEVEPYALYNTASITDLYLPADLNKIGDQAFADMTGLETMKGSNLKQVPELGTDVWGDLNRPDITLVVTQDMADKFKQTPVWQDFAMKIGEPDGSGDIISLNPATVIEHGLNVELVGQVLRVSVENSSVLGRVALYDVAGRLLAVINSQTNEAQFDTRRWPTTHIFIVNTGVGSVKVARKF